MLQPSESPSSLYQSPGDQSIQNQHYQQIPSTGLQGSSHGETAGVDSGQQAKRTIWRWITTKELIFIFLACSIGAALFQTKDSVIFDLAWHERMDISLYQNGKFPTENEKL